MSNWIKPLTFIFVGFISVKIDTVVGCKGSKNIKFDVVHLEIEHCYITFFAYLLMVILYLEIAQIGFMYYIKIKNTFGDTPYYMKIKSD